MLRACFFDGLDEFYHHVKFGEDRTMRGGCRCENVVFVFFTGKLPVLNLLTGQKSVFLRPAGATRCTDSRQTWQGGRPLGSAWLYKISPQSPQGGGNATPEISKISTFW